MQAGEHAYGQPTLEQRLAGDGAAVVAKVREWLALDTPPNGGGQGVGLGSARRSASSSADPHTRNMPICTSAGLYSGPWLHEVVKKPLIWLWDGRIALGAFTLLDGDPGLGKSLVSLDLIARVTIGCEMPDGTPGIDGGAVLLSAEDDLAATVRPRLEAAGADLRRIKAVETVRDVDPEGGSVYERSVIQPRDIPVLSAAIEASEARLAVLILRHLTKGGGTNALYRGGGSIGVIGAARSGLMVAKDRDDPEHARVLAPTKSNLGPPVPALKYRVVAEPGHAPHIEWDGAVEYTANELLAEQETPRQARTAEIDAWLRAQLAEGPLTGDALERRGDLDGWTPKQVRGARDRLKARGDIGKQRSGFGSATVVRWGLRHTLASASVMPSRISNAHSPERAGLSEKGGTEDDEISLASVMPSSISNALITERAKLQNEGRTADAAPDLLDTTDAPTDLTPQPPLPRGEGEPGCAHEYAKLRDAQGRRMCIHCHTIEGTSPRPSATPLPQERGADVVAFRRAPLSCAEGPLARMPSPSGWVPPLLVGDDGANALAPPLLVRRATLAPPLLAGEGAGG